MDILLLQVRSIIPKKCINYLKTVIYCSEDKKIATSQEKNPCKINWKGAGVTYVIDATGVFNTIEKASVRNFLTTWKVNTERL